MAGIPIAGAILGGVAGYKDAKSAKKAADKGIDTTEKTTRDPYGPATSHIQTILDEAAKLYGQGPQGPMPYAWQNFMNNPSSPGAGSDITYGGQQPVGGVSGGGGGGAAEHPLGLTWKGEDKAQVRQARQERRDARNAPAGPAGGGSSPAAAAAGAPSAPSGPQFTPQSGPFGYSKGIRDFMMDKYQQGGVQGYQPAMDYITQLLGGHSQNPFLTQTFDRVSGPQKDYFAAWKKG